MNEQEIIRRLDSISEEMENIKKKMVDIDSIMTEEDYVDLLEYRKQKRNSALIPHKQLKKSLRL